MADPKVYIDLQFNLKNGSIEAVTVEEGRDALVHGDEWTVIQLNESPQLTEIIEVRRSEIASQRSAKRVVVDDQRQ
jgi:hypothetical protein